MLFLDWLATATVLDVFLLATAAIFTGIALERSVSWLVNTTEVKRGS